MKNQMPDWGFLDTAFPGNIRVSDMDGWVEKNGNLLLLEWKRTGASLPIGQEIAFKNLSNQNSIIAFVLHGDPRESIVERISIYQNGRVVHDAEGSNEILRGYCSAWIEKAKNNSFKKVA